MKKYAFLLIALSAILTSCNTSKTYADIINEFRNERGAEYVSVPKALLKVGTAVLPKGDAGNIARSISSVRMLTLDECSQRVKNRFLRRLENANEDGYEPFVQTNDRYEQTRVLMRMDDNYVREILIASADLNDCQIVQVTGKVRLEDVQEIVDENIGRLK